MRLVLVESPFAYKHEDPAERRIGLLRNVTYARHALHDCFLRNEAPYASHLLFTQPFVLDDDIEEERKLGIDAGLLWGSKAEMSVLYTDLGISSGMRYGIENARRAGRPYEERSLPDWAMAASEAPRDTLIRLGLYSAEALDRFAAGADEVFAPVFHR